MQNRLKSKVLWASIASIVVLLASTILGETTGGLVSDIAQIVLAAVAGFGIINNPTNTEGM
jgi:Small integral membrane protein